MSEPGERTREKGSPGASAGRCGGNRNRRAARGGQAPLAIRAWASIVAVQRRALTTIRRDLEREMTLPLFELLGALFKCNDQTRSSLARVMQVTASSVAGLVDRAVRDGLVERHADPADRRAWRVQVTPRGHRAFAQAARHHSVRVRKVFAGLTPAEQAALVHLLEKLHRSLGMVATTEARGRQPFPGGTAHSQSDGRRTAPAAADEARPIARTRQRSAAVERDTGTCVRWDGPATLGGKAECPSLDKCGDCKQRPFRLFVQLTAACSRSPLERPATVGALVVDRAAEASQNWVDGQRGAVSLAQPHETSVADKRGVRTDRIVHPVVVAPEHAYVLGQARKAACAARGAFGDRGEGLPGGWHVRRSYGFYLAERTVCKPAKPVSPPGTGDSSQRRASTRHSGSGVVREAVAIVEG